MNILELTRIDKLYFGCEEIAKALGISLSSAKVTASRYVKQGLLLRMKKNIYVRPEEWKAATQEKKFLLANLGQVPSYISLMTALDYYDITTHLQRNFIESIAIKRTKELKLNATIFRYVKVTGELYCGFKKEKGVFIATPEKALLDAFYLMSYGRYSLDVSALDGEKLDGNELNRLSKAFPIKTRTLLKKKYGYFTTT
jgi:predicted transcriptional regulator of viral defense system